MRLKRILYFFLCVFLFCSGVTTWACCRTDSGHELQQALSNTYYGAQFGVSHARYTSRMLVNSAPNPLITGNLGVSAHIYIGYQFDRYWASELGVIYFYKPEVRDYLEYSGDGSKTYIKNNLVGLYLRGTVPVSRNFNLYGKAGVGYVSRNSIIGVPGDILKLGPFFSFLFAGGMSYQIYSQLYLDASVFFAPPNARYQLPWSTFYGVGLYYLIGKPKGRMKRVAQASQRWRCYSVDVGYYNRGFFHLYVNQWVTYPYLPIFWKGYTYAKSGAQILFDQLFFHTQRVFGFYWGVSVSRWRSLIQRKSFYAVSIFPELKLWFLRRRSVQLYFMYSAAGPSYISRWIIDDQSIAGHFTFQDFLGLGMTLGQRHAFDVAFKIIHYSNGGTLPSNPGTDVPVVLSMGYTF